MGENQRKLAKLPSNHFLTASNKLSLRTFIMIRDDINLCRGTYSSQPNTNPCHYPVHSLFQFVLSKKKINLHETFHTVTRLSRTFIMIRDDMTQCQCSYSSQSNTNPCHWVLLWAFTIPFPPMKKHKLTCAISYINKVLTQHDAPNSHVPAINLLEFLVHAVSIKSYHSRQQICKECL